MSPTEQVVAGWRERVALPDLGIEEIRAKLDTGARSSSLHAADVEEFERDGRTHVRFIVTHRRPAMHVPCEALAVDRRRVSDSSGHRQTRWFIETTVVLGSLRWKVEMSLADRTTMLFPMLLGRTALSGHVVVDPGHSYVLGRRRKKRGKRRPTNRPPRASGGDNARHRT